MAIQDKERNELIDRINALPGEARKAAYDAFRLGHEEGWWLSRTDPQSTVSPVEHAETTNPFKEEPAKPCTCGARKTREACVCPHIKPDGHAVISLAYTNEKKTWITKSKVIPLGDEKVPVEFRMVEGDTVHAFQVRIYTGKTDAHPAYVWNEDVPATILGKHDTYTVWVTPKIVTAAA